MSAEHRIADFDFPPLDEVVLGIQFNPLSQYTTANAGDVWRLYSDEFPIVAEQPRLQPQFEVFGGMPQTGFEFGFGPGDLRNRLWFIAKDDSHLIQFQDDRLLLNWRRRGTGAPYPRHLAMAQQFKNYLLRFQAYVNASFKSTVVVTQAEVSYVNTIPLENLNDIGKWIGIIDISMLSTEVFSSTIAETIRGETGAPVGRLFHELQTVWSPDMQKKAIRWNLTFRGKPAEDNVDSAIEFISNGREIIVKRFCEITTQYAQEQWGRQP